MTINIGISAMAQSAINIYEIWCPKAFGKWYKHLRNRYRRWANTCTEKQNMGAVSRVEPWEHKNLWVQCREWNMKIFGCSVESRTIGTFYWMVMTALQEIPRHRNSYILPLLRPDQSLSGGLYQQRRQGCWRDWDRDGGCGPHAEFEYTLRVEC